MAATETSFYVTGGTLHHDTPSYVERQADTDLYDALQRGEFCYVLTSRQMGKSSLMNRTAARLRAAGIAVGHLDLQAVGQNVTPEQWYLGLLSRLGVQLDLEDELEAFWDEHAQLGPLQRWVEALRVVALPNLGIGSRVLGIGTDPAAAPSGPPTPNTQHPTPRLVIFLDEIDMVRGLPFSTDEFFAAIRECYNRRTQEPEFERLTFCLLGVASPSDLIRDTRLTPFNIGRRIELTDFTEAEAGRLRAGLVLGSPEMSGREEREARALLERVLYWTGGHPYLTQRLCRAVAEDPTARSPAGVDQHCAALFFSSAAQERDDNLIFVRERLLRSEADQAALLDLYAQVRSGKRVPVDDTNQLVSLLRLSGVTRVEETPPFAPSLPRSLAPSARLRVRNRIYERVFDRQWITQHMPDAELRRQRAAFRRGLARAGAAAGLIIAVMAGLTWRAVTMEQRWRTASTVASNNQRLADARATQAEVAREAEQKQRVRANSEAAAARSARDRAEAARQSEQKQRQRADEQSLLANENAADARRQAELARQNAQRANRQRRVADEQRTVAEQQRSEARHNLYASQMNLAQRVWEDGNTGRTVELLEAWRPDPGQEDLRGFEWRYLWRLCQGDSLLTLPLGGFGYVAFSPDHQLLASARANSTAVRLWDLASGRAVGSLQDHQGPRSSLAFSPDGKTLASGSGDKTIKLWDLTSLRGVATLQGHTGGILQVAFSGDGRKLASRSSDRTVKLWDVPARRVVATFQVQSDYRDGGLALSPDANTLAADDTDRTAGLNVIKLWDTRTQREIATLRGHQAPCRCLAFSPDGKILASGSEDNTVGLWDLALTHASGMQESNIRSADRGRPAALLKGHRGLLTCVAFSPDSKTLASSCEDSTIKLWNVGGWQEAGAPKAWGWSPSTLRGHKGAVGPVAFSPDGRTLASRGVDRTVKLWNTAPSSDATVFRGHERYVDCVAFSPDGRTVASSGSEPIVRLWDARTRRVLGILEGHTGDVHCVTFSSDGQFLATGSQDHTARLWDLATKRTVATFKGYAGENWELAFSPDGKTLAMVSQDKTVRLWDVLSHRQVAVLKTRLADLGVVAFSPDGKTLAVTGWFEGGVELWDITSRRAVASLGGGHAVAFSPDGKTLATLGSGAVKLWDVITRRASITLKGSASSRLWNLAFSPDGKTLAAGCTDSTIKLWSVATQQEVATLKGHAGAVWDIAFSPDGTLLASAGIDATIRLWHAPSFQETDTLRVVGSGGNQIARLQWRPLPYALAYNIYHVQADGGHTRRVKLNARPVTETAYTETSSHLVNGRPRTYTVAAVYRGAGGATEEGSPATIHVTPIATPPGWRGTGINEGFACFGSALLDMQTLPRTRGLGEITIRGAGGDVGGTADECYFLHRPLTGDFQITVTALTWPGPPPRSGAPINELAKAGLMIRESLEEGARNASFFATGARGLGLQWRPAPNDRTVSSPVTEQTALKLPILLRLTRKGNLILSEYSTDNGRSFRPAENPVPFDPPLDRTLSVGLAITSQDRTQISQARFSDLKIEPLGHPR